MIFPFEEKSDFFEYEPSPAEIEDLVYNISENYKKEVAGVVQYPLIKSAWIREVYINFS